MPLRKLMQDGPAKADELFTRLAKTSGAALKTRDRLFSELKATLERHAELEERHLLPPLRKKAQRKELVAAAVRKNRDLRAKLGELEVLPKAGESFLSAVAELQKAFRRHARDERRELLPAVQEALSPEQIGRIVQKMEGALARTSDTRQQHPTENRNPTRHRREQAELRSKQQREAEPQDQEVMHAANQFDRGAAEAQSPASVATPEPSGPDGAAEAGDEAARVGRAVPDAQALEAPNEAVEGKPEAASAAPRTGFLWWDMMLAVWGVQPGPSGKSSPRQTEPNQV